ncbi:MAG: SRPBCC domain-containing protein [Chloroflexi bacterium]|nr:SRPBCC domain-containing protein [Chloroflexota bacterium]
MSAIVLTHAYPSDPKQVYFALTNPQTLEGWFANNVEADVRPEGRFYAWWNQGYWAAGTFGEIKEAESVAFTWQGSGAPGPSQVLVRLAAEDGGTKLTVEHSGLGKSEAWKKAAQEIQAGWEAALLNLESVLVRGLDKRLFDRPFVGIMIAGALSAEQAKEQGLDIKGGINLSGTVAGTGAEAAGLQNGDVLVSLGGDEIVDFQSLTAVIGKHKAGDTVKIEYYRGGEKQAADMTFSHRPIPEVSSDPKEFAVEIGKQFEEANRELAALFEGVSEEEAVRRPADTEWSAKETLAHLLMNEYWNLMNVSTEAQGERPPNYGNDLGSVGALAASFPTVADLLRTFERAAAATAGAIAAMPEELQKRRFSLMNMAQAYQYTPNHTRGHFDQIRNAIAAAREQKEHA